MSILVARRLEASRALIAELPRTSKDTYAGAAIDRYEVMGRSLYRSRSTNCFENVLHKVIHFFLNLGIKYILNPILLRVRSPEKTQYLFLPGSRVINFSGIIRPVKDSTTLMGLRLLEGWYLGIEDDRYVWKTLRSMSCQGEDGKLREVYLRSEEIQEGMTQEEAEEIYQGTGELSEANKKYVQAEKAGKTIPFRDLEEELLKKMATIQPA